MKSKISFAVLALVTGATVPQVANAAVLNGGLEADFNNWARIGETRIETANFGVEPVEGRSQAFLSTAGPSLNQEGGAIDNPLGNAACVTFISGFCEDSLELFLDFSTFAGDQFLDSIATETLIEGSAIKQTFQAKAGQMLSFAWNFLTNEPVGDYLSDPLANLFDFGQNDFAFATLTSDSSSEVFLLADAVNSFFNNSRTEFFSETGYKTFSYKIPKTGEYTLGLGVVDVGESTITSALLVDKVEAVPEPVSVLGLFVLGGAMGTGSLLKRRQSRVS